MTDSEMIWKYLTRAYPDDHQVIYYYACGNKQSPAMAIQRVMEGTKQIFCPPITEIFLRTVVKGFLDYKEKQYKRGEIKIKPIYGN